MRKIMRYVGMDVHAESIAIAVVDEGGMERDVAVIPNRPEAIRKCLKKLGRTEELRRWVLAVLIADVFVGDWLLDIPSRLFVSA